MTVPFARAGLALALATALGGCASLAPQPRGDDITPLLEARGGPAVDWAAQAGRADEGDAAIAPLLAKPMTLDAALRVAMLRSPRLQEEYARLGLARAEVIEAVQVENPRISFSRMSLDSGGEKRATGLSLPLLDLLVLPMRARLASAEYERAKLEIASAVLGVVAEVEAAWYEHVTAAQVAAMREAVAEGADASAELAQRFFDAGNISELQLRQEQAVASEARIDALRARAEAGRKALALHALLGLRGEETAWQASDTLPLPVPTEDAPELLAKLAREGNLELLAARQEAEVLADALGITRKLRWLGGSEIGYEREKEADGERLRGPSISLELPVFNQGQGKLARAEAQLAGALARVAQAELSSEHAVRQGAETVSALRRVVATHRESLVPQREAIVARQQERQNFMLIGVFELIQAKVAEYDAYQAYLEAVRDYWLARVELAHAVGQRLPSDAGIGERTPGVRDILAPPASGGHEGMDHSQHGGMDHSKHGVMDHSKHEGMDHSGHDMPEPEPEPEKTEPKEEDEHAHHHGATP
jgi:outer membrane protein TolC